MDDKSAQAAYDAYCALILHYHNPSGAPELPKIMEDLNAAADYLAKIPVNMATKEQETLATRIDSILLRD